MFYSSTQLKRSHSFFVLIFQKRNLSQSVLMELPLLKEFIHQFHQIKQLKKRKNINM